MGGDVCLVGLMPRRLITRLVVWWTWCHGNNLWNSISTLTYPKHSNVISFCFFNRLFHGGSPNFAVNQISYGTAATIAISCWRTIIGYVVTIEPEWDFRPPRAPSGTIRVTPLSTRHAYDREVAANHELAVKYNLICEFPSLHIN